MHGIIILDKNDKVIERHEYSNKQLDPLKMQAKLKTYEIVLKAIDKIIK